MGEGQDLKESPKATEKGVSPPATQPRAEAPRLLQPIKTQKRSLLPHKTGFITPTGTTSPMPAHMVSKDKAGTSEVCLQNCPKDTAKQPENRAHTDIPTRQYFINTAAIIK